MKLEVRELRVLLHELAFGFREPLRSAARRCPMTSLGLRTTAAPWPVYGPPSSARTRREVSREARELSNEVKTFREDQIWTGLEP